MDKWKQSEIILFRIAPCAEGWSGPPLPSPAVKLALWPAGRDREMVGIQTCGSLFFFVSVPESLAGLDGREQQLQYQALLSFTADWIHRRPSCSMPTPLPSLSHRDFFFLPA